MDSPIGANSIVLTLMTLVTVSRAVKIKLEKKFQFCCFKPEINRTHLVSIIMRDFPSGEMSNEVLVLTWVVCGSIMDEFTPSGIFNKGNASV